jgi:AraC-like DNA-binding protein
MKLSPEEKTARRYARTVANFERKHGAGSWNRLLQMYEEGKSFQEIASCFGVSHQAIREMLIRTGIHTPEGTLRRRRIRQTTRRVDEQDLKRRMDEILRKAAYDGRYWSRRGQLSLETVRKELGLSTGRWYKFIKSYPPPHGRVEVVLRYGMGKDPKTYLQEQYESGKPIAEIAAGLEGVGVSPTTLHRYMRYLGIPMRTISEARLIRRWRARPAAEATSESE